MALAIFIASSVPGSALPPGGFPHSDKLVHAAIYAVLAVLCARGLAGTSLIAHRPLSSRWPVGARTRVMIVASLMATTYGATDEIHQIYVPGRAADFADLAADALGATLGAGVFMRRKRFETLRPDGRRC